MTMNASTGPEQFITQTALGSVRTVEEGAGQETVVLLHGFGGDAENWRYVMPALAASRTPRRVVAIDLPGHGESTTAVGTGHLDVLANAVAQVLAIRAPGSLHLIGHSFGAYVAGHVVGLLGHRCSSLSLIAPVGVGQVLNRKYIEGFIRADTVNDMRVALSMLFANKAIVTSAFAEDVLTKRMRTGVTDALRALADGMYAESAANVVDLARDADIPVSLIWGTEDEVLPPPTGINPLGVTSADLMSGVGHSPHVEAPGRVQRSLTRFMEAVAN